MNYISGKSGLTIQADMWTNGLEMGTVAGAITLTITTSGQLNGSGGMNIGQTAGFTATIVKQ